MPFCCTLTSEYQYSKTNICREPRYSIAVTGKGGEAIRSDSIDEPKRTGTPLSHDLQMIMILP